MMQSDRKNKALILFLASWAGIVFLALLLTVKLPAFISETRHLTLRKSQLSDRNDLKLRMNAFIEAFKARAEAIENDLTARQNRISASSFTRFPETALPEFVDNLPRMVASAGVKLANLGYKPRENLEGYVDQAFELSLSGQYQQIRKLLYILETHPAAIRIESLEFVTLDNSDHEAQINLQCRVRFIKNG
ncbi:MAG TPA: hypothetical protein PLK28_03995 [Candidatus Rifleibacterium sp.]|nr:hypothetical protein [Candidatus Rifleibacterium sp.]